MFEESCGGWLKLIDMNVDVEWWWITKVEIDVNMMSSGKGDMKKGTRIVQSTFKIRVRPTLDMKKMQTIFDSTQLT